LPTGIKTALSGFSSKSTQPTKTMKLTQTLLTAAALSCFAYSASAQSVFFDFDNDTVTGGTLVLLEAGSGPTNSFAGDRFDEQASASFQVTGIGGGIGTLAGTASALSDDLNVTGSGLQDGSSGYNGSGEGTSFVFDKDVTITAMDWGGFTVDSVTLSSGATNIGTFTTGTVIGSTNFTSSNPATMNIAVSAGDAFTLTYASGSFFLESMSFTVVPEPGTYALLAGICALGYVMTRRRSAV
jgi:hypothetical protein